MTTLPIHRLRRILLPVLTVGSLGLAAIAADDEATDLLADGELSAWSMQKPDGWKVDNGELQPNGTKTGYIWSTDSYGDFELSLEFKMSEKCNSGVFFRTDPSNAVQGGFEIQVFDSAAKGDDIDSHDCGALYDALVPSSNAAKPAGEWNTMTITAQGPQVVVVLNGVEVINANLDDWTTAGQNPDGSKNKFKTALKDLPREGHIGLQEHGHPVWYRNISIRPL